MVGVVIFHDASVAALGALIYLQIEDSTGTKHLRIARSGTKCGNHSVPTLEHISKSYVLVLLKPLLRVLKNIAGDAVDFFFFSDSTCSLPLLKPEVRTTNKLSSNSKIQLEQLTLLSNMFPEGTVRALWCPSRLNLADMITHASLDPISVANSDAYRIGVLPTKDRITELMEGLVPANTFVLCANGNLEITPRDDNSLEDMGFFDKARRKAQVKKKNAEGNYGASISSEVKVQASVGGILQSSGDTNEVCNNNCNLSDCIVAQAEYLHNDGSLGDIEMEILTQDEIDNEESPVECLNSVPNNTNSVIGGVHILPSKDCETNSDMMKAWKFLVQRYKGAPTTVPIYSTYTPRVQTCWIGQKYYERLMSSSWPLDNILRIMSMRALRLALQEKDNRGFNPYYGGFKQLILASQLYFPVQE